MSEQFFSYKTRGNVSPQGKQKVFVCGIKEDIQLYLDGIADDILKLNDCAIWYMDPEKEYDDETLLSLIDGITLFVFILTNRLLFSDDPLIRSILSFAKDNCRAILPIKTESIDDNQFNEIFDSANYLDKFAEDPTAVRYDEKLRVFLSNVLVSEALAMEVRQAFDAYIFLSYRKKDRYFAQKLVKKIHERDFCRDIAVWYDEYLTPGRNFEDVIRDMMNKSSLFAVAITPHILEEGNWVLKHEIPDALNTEKKILLAELAKVDTESLYRQFDKLPECTDAENDEALTRALQEAFSDMDLMKNAGSPEHNFKIGLAYLMGIDTEIDRERALQLITGAAKEDYIDAIRMLVAMYRSGQGVKTNFIKALSWQERETDYYKREYIVGGSDGKMYAVSLFSLSEAYLELGDRKKAREVMSDLRYLLDNHPESRMEERTNFVFYHKLGNIAKDGYEHEEALKCYQKALEEAERIAEKDHSLQAKQDLALAHAMPGMIYRREKKIDAALPHTLEAFRIYKELDEQYHTEQTARDLLVGSTHLGEIYQMRGEYAESEKQYKKSLEIAEQLHKGKETLLSTRDLFVTYMKFSDLAVQKEQYQEAVVYAMSAMPYAEGLYERTQTPAARNDLINTVKQMRIISEKTGDLKSYCFFQQKFIELFSEMSNPDPAMQLYNKAYQYNELGRKCTEKGETGSAELYHQKALSILNQAKPLYSSFDLLREIGVTYYDLAENAIKDRKTHEGTEWVKAAIKSQEELFGQTGRVEVGHDIGLSYLLLGSLGDRSAFDHAIKLWNVLYQNTGNQTFLNAMNSAIKLRDRMACNPGPATEKREGSSYSTASVIRMDQVGLTDIEKKFVSIAISSVKDSGNSRIGVSPALMDQTIQAVLKEQPVKHMQYAVIMACVDNMINIMKGSPSHRMHCEILQSAFRKLEKNQPTMEHKGD